MFQHPFSDPLRKLPSQGHGFYVPYSPCARPLSSVGAPGGWQPSLPNRRRHLLGNFVWDDPGSPASHVSCHCGLMAEVCCCFSTSVFADAAKARRADHDGIHPLNSFCWFEKVWFLAITCQLIFNDLVLMSRFMRARSPLLLIQPVHGQCKYTFLSSWMSSAQCRYVWIPCHWKSKTTPQSWAEFIT